MDRRTLKHEGETTRQALPSSPTAGAHRTAACTLLMAFTALNCSGCGGGQAVPIETAPGPGSSPCDSRHWNRVACNAELEASQRLTLQAGAASAEAAGDEAARLWPTTYLGEAAAHVELAPEVYAHCEQGRCEAIAHASAEARRLALSEAATRLSAPSATGLRTRIALLQVCARMDALTLRHAACASLPDLKSEWAGLRLELPEAPLTVTEAGLLAQPLSVRLWAEGGQAVPSIPISIGTTSTVETDAEGRATLTAGTLSRDTIELELRVRGDLLGLDPATFAPLTQRLSLRHLDALQRRYLLETPRLRNAQAKALQQALKTAGLRMVPQAEAATHDSRLTAHIAVRKLRAMSVYSAWYRVTLSLKLHDRWQDSETAWQTQVEHTAVDTTEAFNSALPTLAQALRQWLPASAPSPTPDDSQ